MPGTIWQSTFGGEGRKRSEVFWLSFVAATSVESVCCSCGMGESGRVRILSSSLFLPTSLSSPYFPESRHVRPGGTAISIGAISRVVEHRLPFRSGLIGFDVSVLMLSRFVCAWIARC